MDRWSFVRRLIFRKSKTIHLLPPPPPPLSSCHVQLFFFIFNNLEPNGRSSRDLRLRHWSMTTSSFTWLTLIGAKIGFLPVHFFASLSEKNKSGFNFRRASFPLESRRVAGIQSRFELILHLRMQVSRIRAPKDPRELIKKKFLAFLVLYFLKNKKNKSLSSYKNRNSRVLNFYNARNMIFDKQ